MKKIIIIAHPNYEISKVTKGIVKKIINHSKDTDVHVLNNEGIFNIKKEQELLLKYDVITFAFPIWWYTTPWIFNKYLSDVMIPGFAFSFKGNVEDSKLKGKKFSYIVAIGNTEKSYQKNEVNLFSVERYLSHLNGWFHMASTGWPANPKLKAKNKSEYMIEPIICYGSAIHATEINKAAHEYLKRIDILK